MQRSRKALCVFEVRAWRFKYELMAVGNFPDDTTLTLYGILPYNS